MLAAGVVFPADLRIGGAEVNMYRLSEAAFEQLVRAFFRPNDEVERLVTEARRARASEAALIQCARARLSDCDCLRGVEQGDMPSDFFLDHYACADCVNDRAVIERAEGDT